LHISARSRATFALVLFAGLAAFALSAAHGTTPAKAAANKNLCQIDSLQVKPSPRLAAPRITYAGGGAVAHGSGAVGTIGYFLLEKAVGVQIEKYALMGISSVLKMINANAITPLSHEEKSLAALNSINARLGELENQVAEVSASVNELTAQRQEEDLNKEIIELCGIADRQMNFFNLYRDAIEEGTNLGAILSGPDPKAADVPDDFKGRTPRQRAKTSFDLFVEHYGQGSNKSIENLGRLKRALIPSSGQPAGRTVLRSFGRVLMSRNRFINRNQSVVLRDLGADVSEIRALTSWMAAEYWNAEGSDSQEKRILNAFRDDTKSAEAARPKLIPPGVIIDVGAEQPTSTNERPMWFAPTSLDLGWLPTFDIGRHVFGIDEVDHEINRLNTEKSPLNGWHAPRNQEFRALISTGCSANPHPHKHGEVLTGCRSAVPGDANLGAYLAGINKHDETWQKLFCKNPSDRNACPAGSGPMDTHRKYRHFVWTSDVHIQQLSCPWEGVRVTVPTRTYAGTTTVGPLKHQIFPHFPGRINADCISYLRGLIGDPKTGVGRNPRFEGILLATRYTGPVDTTSRPDHLDYMAQPTN
jgi:hypothetical protein